MARQKKPTRKNLTPPDGVESAMIAPPDGVESYPTTPPDGAIRVLFDHLPTPPDGDHLEKPSTVACNDSNSKCVVNNIDGGGVVKTTKSGWVVCGELF